MKNYLTRSAVAAVAFVALTSNAHAGYTLSMQNAVPGSVVAGRLNGNFSAAGLGIDLNSITNVRFSATFTDDSDTSSGVLGADSAPVLDPYTCVYTTGGTYCERFNRVTATMIVTHEKERVDLSFGNGPVVASSATNATVSSGQTRQNLSQTLDQRFVSGSTYVDGYGYIPTYTTYKTTYIRNVSVQTFNYTGPMSLNYEFNNPADETLGVFRASGNLLASLNFLGDARLGAATLTFDALEKVDIAAVPEPASYSLVLGALGLLAVARRRRPCCNPS